MSNYIVGLDIGTSKIVTVIGEVKDLNTIEIIGIGKSKSKGMSRGIVVDIQDMTDAIKKSIRDAELMAKYQIENVYAGISGNHIRCMNSSGKRNIEGDTVVQSDVDDVLERALTTPMNENEEILHCVPKDYIIDDQGGIRNPVGMAGRILSVQAHLVAASSTACQNVIKCIDNCNLNCTALVLEQIASSHSVLSEDERDLGVCLVDIGAGTADIAVFSEGGIQFTSVIPIAGNTITNEIAAFLRTPRTEAEIIKTTNASAYARLVNPDEMIEVKSIGESKPTLASKQVVSQFVEANYTKILKAIKQLLESTKFLDSTNAGIVLTGGSSKINDIVTLASEIFELPIRVGNPKLPHIKGMSDITDNPSYSTAIGLVQYGFEQMKNNQASKVVSKKAKAKKKVKKQSIWQWILNQF